MNILAHLVCLSSPASAGESIRDLEMGVRGELPLVASPSITEAADGKGNSQLHVGWEGFFAYVLTPRWAFTGTFGTRWQYLGWPADEGFDPLIQTRAMRVYFGARASFLQAPTFVAVNASGGLVSSYWRLDIGGVNGDRRAAGPGALLGVELTHFVNRRFALSVELRGWTELHDDELLAVAETDDSRGWAFQHQKSQSGVSLLAGVLFR